MWLVFDYETRSRQELRGCSTSMYAQHKSTDILCCAMLLVHPDGTQTDLFYDKDQIEELRVKMYDLINDPDVFFVAHNMHFEYMITRYQLKLILPLDRCYDTADLCRMCAIPASLKGAGTALKLTTQKQDIGTELINKLSKPPKLLQKHIKMGLTEAPWNEDPVLLKQMYEYCTFDVYTTYELFVTLHNYVSKRPDRAYLNTIERRLMLQNSRLNIKGIPVSRREAGHYLGFREFVVDKIDQFLIQKYDLETESITSREQFKLIMRALGLELQSLDKEKVLKPLLKTELKPHIRELLEIRLALAASAYAKLRYVMLSPFNRATGCLAYFGAHTGRYAGRGLQPHNLPRDKVPDNVNALSLTNQVLSLKSRLRSLITIPGGHILQADFSGIEARIMAWVTNDFDALEAFRNNRDPYKIAASQIYNIPYEEVTSDQRAIGKYAELALGFQGSVGAFYRFLPPDVNISAKAIADIVKMYRTNIHPNYPKFWKALETAFTQAINLPVGQSVQVGDTVIFIIRETSSNLIQLPSGRCIRYLEPTSEMEFTTYSEPVYDEAGAVTSYNTTERSSMSLYYKAAMAGGLKKESTYGGKLTENVVQAIARDLLCHSLLKLDDIKAPLLFHVHDEFVCKETDDFKLEDLLRISTEVPEWAFDFPLAAEGWRGERYKK